MREFLHRSIYYRARSRARLRDPAYAFLFEPEYSAEAVVFDTETTGLSRRHSDIISLAAIRIRGNRLLLSQRLELLVRPSAAIEHAAVAVHGLRPMDVAGGLPAREAMGRFLRFIGTRPLVGYYLEFDIAMVNRVIRPWLGVSLPNRADRGLGALLRPRDARPFHPRGAVYRHGRSQFYADSRRPRPAGAAGARRAERRADDRADLSQADRARCTAVRITSPEFMRGKGQDAKRRD